MSLGFVLPNLSDAMLVARPYNYWGKVTPVPIRYTNGNSFNFPPIHLFGGTIQKTVRTERTPPCHIPPVRKLNGGNPAVLNIVMQDPGTSFGNGSKEYENAETDLKGTTYTSCVLFSSVCLYTGVANRGTAFADN